MIDVRTEAGETKGIRYLKIDGENENGSILIFLPGIGNVKENYLNHLNQFTSLYTTIYAIDLPEQGSQGQWTFGNMVDNLKTFIQEVDNSEIQTIDLAGHSAGSVAIISFMVNYNKDAEEVLTNSENYIGEQMIHEAMSNGFMQQPPEASKVEKLMLYSPPISTNNPITKRIIRSGLLKNKTLVRLILNLFINIPMLVFRAFTRETKVDFSIHPSNQPQFYHFVMEDHNRFLKYSANYHTIFALAKKSELNLTSNLTELLGSKKILIQYGGFDWLIKLLRSQNSELASFYKISENVEIVKHDRLGHFLGKNNRLDINLNLQMVTNDQVINNALTFIKKPNQDGNKTM